MLKHLPPQHKRECVVSIETCFVDPSVAVHTGGRFPGTSVSFYWQMAVSGRDTQWQFYSHKCTLRE